ncbi:MAG: hypothetical protein ABI644_14525 [Arenimonas sp.]
MRYLFAILLLISLPAAATPKDEVHAAYTRFLAMKSFKASNDSTYGKDKTSSSVEFVMPDRYRVTNSGRPPSVIIGNSMYIDMDGHMMKIPMPGLKNMIGQYRNPEIMKELQGDVVVESLGTETLNGKPTKKYRYSMTKPQASTNMMWVGANGDILQIDSSGTMNKKAYHTVIQYSQYNNATIKIDAP